MNSVVSALPYLGASAGVLTLAWAALRGVRSWYGTTLGSRRTLAARLNLLANGATQEYVNSLLGVPKFNLASPTHSRSVHVSKHALVMVSYNNTGSVEAFAICSIDRRFKFDLYSLSVSLFNVRLGHTRFTDCGSPVGFEYYGFQGAARSQYVELHYFGRPGGYQNFLLSASHVGVSSGGVTIRGATGAFESVIPDYVASEPQAYRCRALPFPKASDD